MPTAGVVGCTQGELSVWYGVELDKPVGRCSGEFKGVEYFSCAPKHGVFVQMDQVSRWPRGGRCSVAAAVVLASPPSRRRSPARQGVLEIARMY
jgi:CAP-Gly domain-containing linker protein 3/4